MSLVPRNGKVAVVGAGISGLCYTYFLHKLRPDLHISVHEASKEPGGWIKSLKLSDNGSDLILEKGPRTLRGVSDGTLLIVDIMKQLGLEKEVEVMSASSPGNRKWLLDPAGSLVQVPNSFLLFAKFVSNDVSQGLVPSIFREPFRKSSKNFDDESIRSFITRRFGSPQLADNVLSAVMHGIYSGDVDKLSVRATLPNLVKLEQEQGSIVKAVMRKMVSKKKVPEVNPFLHLYELKVSPGADLEKVASKLKKYPIMRLHSGLQTLPLAMAQYLKAQTNVKLNFANEVSALGLKNCSLSVAGKTHVYDHVRHTLGLQSLSYMTNFENRDVLPTLQTLEYSTIFLANIYTKKKGLIPKNGNGFGFLVPRRNHNPESLLGVIYDSDTELDAERFVDRTKFGKASYDKITLMIGGHYFNARGVPSNKVNLKATRNVLQNNLGVDLTKFNIVERDEARMQSSEVLLADNDLLISYNLHKDCIPQYNVGFLERSGFIRECVEKESAGKVTLGGPSLGKLGVPDCVMNELEAALRA
ncbi:Protoporphyrinogen oxidase [Metschnikowia bicuspidata var. bicuspidata NRRL YB-4993]|uniref:Protoporphyrinogen oxidase n=1 Tax=Metschnikowia bicuspidata var. bicuspidata NRRL YB-4993 TaxID=869754 RepID=A0A1A0HGP9_9ASCO|nr:Protoporphyrinogen oxidase [Metschnikowia bicuspidata var. bicuspidata NRRL YB-4993]OBA23349.1 Protoporphyrinogen oxidase [Metschnikowia bicuspidata var. bicuspidata NRRL YB-4993]